jgi:hypothetical protein
MTKNEKLTIVIAIAIPLLLVVVSCLAVFSLDATQGCIVASDYCS